jgi:putative endopeptidase
MKWRLALLAGAAVLATASCKQPAGNKSGDTSGKNLLDRANMDTTVHPGDNFFEYANGTWLKKNPVPNSETRWGSFNELQENNYRALHTLLDSAAGITNAQQGSLVQKVGDFYRTGMDSATIDKIGLGSLNDIIVRINNIRDVNDVINEIALEHTQGVGPLFSFGVSPDDKNVTKEICQFGQAGLGMPGREYYFDKDERTVNIREAYRKYIPKMMILMGDDTITAAKDASEIYNLELTLADASLTRVQMRDPYKLYNKMSIDGISKMTPGLDWKTLMTNLKVSGQDTVIVGMPAFFTAVGKELKATPVDTWKKYLKYHLVNDMAPFLSSVYDSTHFNFYGKIMRGQKEQRPRWKRIMQVVDGYEGELLGQLYVAKYFRPEAKKRMLELVNNLQQTYAERIQKLDWMSDSTKKKATIKLNAFMKKIGYPDKWRDYSALVIVNSDFVKNILASSQWEYNYMLNKLGKPVDRMEWGMTPPTVNAYYNPAFNEIVFPAGILQYPFFDEQADDAVNYGGIGAVIGHEMTHGFDDQGRLYNAEGNLSNWWSPADSANFTNKANMVVDQFNQIIVIDTNHANGRLTEGENLADLGGINIAYEAYKKTKQGQSNDKIDGFTGDQRFFLSWAQVWRANTVPEELASRLKTDPHSPSVLRCNVPVSNVGAWYKAFDVKPTDKMFRPEAERARVW